MTYFRKGPSRRQACVLRKLTCSIIIVFFFPVRKPIYSFSLFFFFFLSFPLVCRTKIITTISLSAVEFVASLRVSILSSVTRHNRSPLTCTHTRTRACNTHTCTYLRFIFLLYYNSPSSVRLPSCVVLVFVYVFRYTVYTYTFMYMYNTSDVCVFSVKNKCK